MTRVGATILDSGKEIGSRRLVVTENEETLSIVEESSLALTFDGAPLGIVELDVSAVYAVAGDTPRIMRATTSAKEQGALLMHGTVEFETGEALTRWTTYKQSGRKLEPPRKQQATLKQPPSGPLMLDSTIQIVGPLLLPKDGERTIVRAKFNNEAREGKPLVEYEARCRLRRTSRPGGAGFTITVFKPDSDKPEMTLEYDSQGTCESIQLTRTTVMKPHEAAEEAEADIAPAGRSESSDDFEREVAKWVLANGGVVVLKNVAGRYEKVEKVDDLPARQFTITHIGLGAETLTDEDLKRLEGLHLRTLTLTGTQVTDAGLAYLQRVPQLDYLVLNHCPRISLSDVSGLRHVKALSLRDTPAISEGALKLLEKLPNLSQLDIGENRQFTDRALTHIATLKKLTLLALDSTDISDAGLKHLAPLDGLYTLNLASTAITDAGLKHLSAHDALFDLNLASTAISDDGLKHLAPLDLYALNLNSTAISDAGLKQLASHDGLRRLSLNGTGVTEQGVEELREALSEECQIDWESRADDGGRADKKVQSAKPSKALGAAAQINAIKEALDRYRLDCRTYPSTKEGLKSLIQKPADEERAENWSGPYLKELPTDPWGNAFEYRFPGTKGGDATKPDIWSRGLDGKGDTADDIAN